MKILKKLSINPEKVIKNEELVNLNGGYGTGCCACYIGGIFQNYIVGSTQSDCDADCKAIQNGWGGGVWEC
jgi:hypothetical protein